MFDLFDPFSSHGCDGLDVRLDKHVFYLRLYQYVVGWKKVIGA